MAKLKRCKNLLCQREFVPSRPMQVVCGPHCAKMYVGQKEKNKFNKQTAKMRKELRENDRKWWMEKAKKACHKYIRERDKYEPCISCRSTIAKKWDAGHYRPSGNNSFLRFNELNIHKQCSRPCNKDMSGNLIQYRLGLVEKIGENNVIWLEKSFPPKKWTIDELKGIVSYYKRKFKELPT